MLRANSLKKALRQIIEQAEKGNTAASWALLFSSTFHVHSADSSLVPVVDEQNRHTQVQRMSSSSSFKRENSDELKDAEPRK